MRTLVWWSVWGLVVGTGLFGLRQSVTYGFSLIVAVPLLTGALAAAVLKIRHEYHEALMHAKWGGLTMVFFSLGAGFLYVRAEGYGPFATATAHKAMLGTTFEMSPPEVERALGRKLVAPTSTDSHVPDSLKDWVIEMLPHGDELSEARILPALVLYGVPAQARFGFVSGRLATVDIGFNTRSVAETNALLERLQDDLAKSYHPATNAKLTYRKEAVEATIARADDPLRLTIQVRYLPLATTASAPLAADAQIF